MCVLGDLTYEPRRRPRKRRSERKEAPPRTAASAAGRGGACIRVHFVGAEAAAGRLGSMSPTRPAAASEKSSPITYFNGDGRHRGR